MATKRIRTKKEKEMPKIDPDDQSTASTTAAPAPLPAGQTSTSGFGSTSTTGGFGSATTTPTSSGSTFGSAPSSGFGGASSGFGSTQSTGFGSSSSTGAGAFGSSSGGFGGSSSFGGSSGGFGGGMSGGGFGGGMSGGMGGMNQNPIASAETANAFGNVMAAQAASGAEPEHWMKSFWRPAMGWLYMLICFCDFIVFPALTMFLPVIERMFGLTMGYTPWQSLTLSNGGLIHLSFGAILGVSAYGRNQEKKV